MFIIYPAKITDVDTISGLHINNLKEYNDLQLLGEKVVRKFYRNVIKRQLGDIFIVKDFEGNAVGYTLVTQDENKLFKNSLISNFIDIIQLISVANPYHLIRIFIKKAFSDSLNLESCPLLVYLVIDNSVKGKGLGKKLIFQADCYFKEKNLNSYYLDVEPENISAQGFYVRQGFQKIRQYSVGSSIKIRMIKNLS